MARLLHHAFGILFFAAGANAEDPSSNLPSTVDAHHFSALMDHSPFTRIVVISDSLILTGIAKVGGKPIATLMDTEVVETIAVSEIPTIQGWKLVEISGTEDIETAVAVIAIRGGDVIRIRYNKERMKTASQRRKFAAQAKAQRSAAQARAQSGNAGNHGVPQERVTMLKKIDQRELPEGYNPGRGKSREESHTLHQSYVDRRLGGMSDRQKGMVGQMWKQKTAVEPNMPNRGASFVRIMEHVAENEKR